MVEKQTVFFTFYSVKWPFSNGHGNFVKESGKSVLVRKSLVKSREKGYLYRSKSTLFILVKVPSFPRKGVNWERSFPFPGKVCNWERFQQFFERFERGKERKAFRPSPELPYCFHRKFRSVQDLVRVCS